MNTNTNIITMLPTAVVVAVSAAYGRTEQPHPRLVRQAWVAAGRPSHLHLHLREGFEWEVSEYPAKTYPWKGGQKLPLEALDGVLPHHVAAVRAVDAHKAALKSVLSVGGQ